MEQPNPRKYKSSSSVREDYLSLAARRDTLIADGETKRRHGWYVEMEVVEVVAGVIVL